MTKVLVIDDEPSILRALRINLAARGYEVTTALDGSSGLAAVSRERPDVLILDLGLPDMEGTDVIHGVRGWASTPIIVLSVWGQEQTKVAALDAGADDYVTKPFGMDELLARLRAAVRRAAPATPDEPVVTTPDFTVDLAAKRVTPSASGAADVRLTPTEWQLLEILVRNRGRLVIQRQLLQEVWGPTYGSESNYLRVYVAQLRRKLEPEPAHPRYLLTEPGMGYRFECPMAKDAILSGIQTGLPGGTTPSGSDHSAFPGDAPRTPATPDAEDGTHRRLPRTAANSVTR
jgi:two-component system KDP operon response regulator KdpE